LTSIPHGVVRPVAEKRPGVSLSSTHPQIETKESVSYGTPQADTVQACIELGREPRVLPKAETHMGERRVPAQQCSNFRVMQQVALVHVSAATTYSNGVRVGRTVR
jgi:hypothetical protein